MKINLICYCTFKKKIVMKNFGELEVMNSKLFPDE